MGPLQEPERMLATMPLSPRMPARMPGLTRGLLSWGPDGRVYLSDINNDRVRVIR
jgi:hypothetical protein